MKDKLMRALALLKRPTAKILLPLYTLTPLLVAGSVISLFFKPETPLLEAAVYALYTLTAVSLGYTVYTVILFLPSLKRGILRAVDGNRFTRELAGNYGYRALVGSGVSFTVGIAYGIFNGVLGILGRSVWYGALAAYYILVAALRAGIFLHYRRKEESDLGRARIYRNTGVLMIILNTALSSAIAQMIFDDRAFVYAGLAIYAAAAYTFSKITVSVINLVRHTKEGDLALQSILNVGLADSAVSVLALQTALLHTFSEGEVNVSLFNTLTGSAVSLLTLGLGIFMVVKSKRIIRKIKNGQQ